MLSPPFIYTFIYICKSDGCMRSKLGEKPVLLSELLDELHGGLAPVEVFFLIFEVLFQDIVRRGGRPVLRQDTCGAPQHPLTDA